MKETEYRSQETEEEDGNVGIMEEWKKQHAGYLRLEKAQERTSEG